MPIRSPPSGDLAVPACIAFLLGVLLHAARPFDATAGWVLIALVVSAVTFYIFNNLTIQQFNNPAIRQPSIDAGSTSFRLFFISLLLLSFAFGLLRHDLTLPQSDDPLERARGQDVALIARVTDVRQYDALLGVVSVNGERIRSRARILLPRGHGYQNAGELWDVSCRIESTIKSDESGVPSKTALFNARDGAFFACKGSISARKLKDSRWWDPRAMLGAARTAITARISAILPGDEGALLAGILYGERGLSSDAAQAFRFAGMTHIIAVSGSNVTIVVACFVPLFLAFGYRRRFAIVLSVIAICTFVLFVGASASVVRAAIMGSLALLARAFGRRASASRLLVIAAAALTLVSPWTLAFDAGFALSFLATWGLMALGEPMAKFLRFLPERFGLREAAATTASATIATMPYQLWAFSSASLAGLLTNLLVLPFLGAVMASGAVAVLIGGAIPAVTLPAEGFLSYMLGIAKFSQGFPFLLIPISLPTGVLFFCYGLMMFIFSRRTATKSIYPQKTAFESLF
jgi:ComEC/Rec2-related protein